MSQWFSGAAHLPADVLPHLAEFTERADLVLEPFCLEAGGRFVDGREAELDPLAALRRLIPEAADVIAAVSRAEDPRGAGGASWTPGEALDALREIDELIEVAKAARVQLRGIVDAPPARRVG